MLSTARLSVLLALILSSGCSEPEEEPFRGAAPEEAFLEDDDYPYFGSEEEWEQGFFTDRFETQVKRWGQRQMLAIVRGNPEEAIRHAEQLLAADPGEQESLFNVAVAHAQLGRLDQAMEAVRRAEDAGLPFERFLAGPRDLLKPLTEHEPFRQESDARDIKLLHGPMVGSVTGTSARFWVRTAEESDVQVIAGRADKLSPDENSPIARTSAEADYTAIIELQGLEPNTIYGYEVMVDSQPTLAPDYPSFRTFPSRGAPAQFEIGFGGGAGFVPQHERMWDVIRSRNPLAFFFLGDNVYIDLPEQPNGVHYYTYYRRQSREEFRRLAASTAIYAIWDDHDSAMDDIWLGPYKDKPPWKLPLWRQFRENWVNPGYGTEEWPGAWFDFSIGDVDFFMLDGRFYRTNPYAETRTMLGPAQKKWLFERVKQSAATFKVLVSPVPWAFDSKGDALDTWNGFREERTEIFDFLAENKIEGVFLLSADRHRSDAWRIERPNSYPLYEFESSRLTNQHVHAVMPGALFGYNEKQSFGLLSFDTTKPDPTVTYRIVSIDDEIKGELTLKRSQLTHAE